MLVPTVDHNDPIAPGRVLGEPQRDGVTAPGTEFPGLLNRVKVDFEHFPCLRIGRTLPDPMRATKPLTLGGDTPTACLKFAVREAKVSSGASFAPHVSQVTSDQGWDAGEVGRGRDLNPRVDDYESSALTS